MKLVLPVPVPVPVPVSSGDLTSWWSNTNTGNTAQKGEMRCMNHSSSLLMLSNKRAYIMTWYNMTWLFFDGLNFGAIRSDWLAWTRAWTTVSSNIIFLFFLFFYIFIFGFFLIWRMEESEIEEKEIEVGLEGTKPFQFQKIIALPRCLIRIWMFLDAWNSEKILLWDKFYLDFWKEYFGGTKLSLFLHI